jgi:8-oxo-dGTP diphosphatase
LTSGNDSRRYPEHPFIGVGGLVFDGGRVLLVERGNDPLKGWWSVPGGILETGERLIEGVKREVAEETGLDVEPYEMFEIFERILRDDEGRAEYHYVLIDYLCRVTGGEARAADDAAGLAWVKREELRSYKITAGTLEVVERAFEKLRERGELG